MGIGDSTCECCEEDCGVAGIEFGLRLVTRYYMVFYVGVHASFVVFAFSAVFRQQVLLGHLL